MKTTPAYRIEHSNPDVYCMEAYGVDHHPVFTDRDEAEAFLARCVEAWPADADDARAMYSIDEYESLEDAVADGHGRWIVSTSEAMSLVRALSR